MLKYYIGIDIFQENIIEMLFIYYFIGSIISRIGSIIVEPILIKCNFIKYASYEDYNKAREKNKNITRLLVVNNMYRTICSGGIILLVANIFKKIIEKFSLSMNFINTILIVLVILLYLFSYKKQTKFIFQRVNKKED